MKRMLRVLVLGAVVAGLVGVVGAGSASAGSGEVGYTVGFEQPEGGIECDFFSVGLASGELTRVNDPLTDVVECADGLTFGPDGTLYAYVSPLPRGFTNATLVTIDTATGVQTPVGNLPPVILGEGGMTFDGAGRLWLYGQVPPAVDPDCGQTGFEVCLWEVNPADATTRFVGSTTDRQVYGLAATCTEVLAITTPIPGGPVGSGTEIMRVNTETAALEPVVSLATVFGPEGLDFDFAGGLWSLNRIRSSGLFSLWAVSSIDLTNGAAASTELTLEGNEFFGFVNGLAISPLSCQPEPVVLAPTFTG